MSSRLIYVVAYVRIPSFLRLNNVPFYVYTTFCLSVHLLVDTRVVSTFWLLWIMPLWTWVYNYLFKSLLSILLDKYPEMKLLDYIAMLFLIFWGIIILFSIVAAPFHVPMSSARGFQFLHILGNTCYLLYLFLFCLIGDILMGKRCYLIIVLICISLMISDLEHFSRA